MLRSMRWPWNVWHKQMSWQWFLVDGHHVGGRYRGSHDGSISAATRDTHLANDICSLLPCWLLIRTTNLEVYITRGGQINCWCVLVIDQLKCNVVLSPRTKIYNQWRPKCDSYVRFWPIWIHDSDLTCPNLAHPNDNWINTLLTLFHIYWSEGTFPQPQPVSLDIV